MRPKSPRIAVRAIIVEDGRLLMVNAWPDGRSPLMCAPGGGVEVGSSLPDNLTREVFEETGWRMRLDRRLGFYRRFTFMPEYDMWAEKICTIYLGQPTMQLSAPLEEGHTPLWVHRSDAPDILTNSGDAEFMNWFA